MSGEGIHSLHLPEQRLKHVDHLSRILTVAKQEISDLKELRGGHLSIGAAHSAATQILPNLIEAYRAKYPKVNLSIESGWSIEISKRIVRYDLDLGLLVLVSQKLEGFPQLTFVPLATTDLVFVVSPNDPLTKRSRLVWDDLLEAPWILNQEGCVYRSYIERRLQERGYSCLVFRKDRYIHGPMKAFLQLLKETFGSSKNGLKEYFEPS